MAVADIIKTAFLCALVLGILLAPVFFVIQRKIKNRNIIITVYVLFLVWLARFGVSLLSSGAEALEITGLSPIERFFDSMVHSLQTFSMDEDYTSYVTAGKDLLKESGHYIWASVYGVVVSVLNVCAPILGGALLLEILAGVFPYIRIQVFPFRHKFIFSELNDASITLAEDLSREKNFRKFLGMSAMERDPMIIFTDAYPDESSELRTELFGRARAINAVCVRTDLLHLPVRKSKTVSYFLMNTTPGENISAIASLLQKDEDGHYLWPDPSFSAKDSQGRQANDPAVKIYVFTKEDLENELVWQACRNMGAESSKVLIRPIRDYMNTAFCLMFDVPLFLPLLEEQAACVPGEGSGQEQKAARVPDEGSGQEQKAARVPDEGSGQEQKAAHVTGEASGQGQQAEKTTRDLYVSIIGSDDFAEELLKAVFWCGQMRGVQLHIDVLSEDPSVLRRKLFDECPEMLKSSREEEKTDTASGILKVYPDDPSRPENPPYCIFRFLPVEDPLHCSTYPAGILERTDYFIISLGNDADNLRVSGKIRTRLARMAKRRRPGHAVIAPAIFNRELAGFAGNLHPEAGDPYVLPFADLNSRFSYRNVQMDTFLMTAEKDEELYDASKQEEMKKDEYSHWLNLSRALHYPYKLFSLGLVESVELEKEGEEKYRIRCPYKVSPEEDEALAWMEHRRWNAFLRAQGFMCPTEEQFRRYYQRHCDHGRPELFKDVALRFHPCLVERGMGDGKEPHGPDMLDLAGLAHNKDYKQYDYKEYDADLMKYLQ